MRIATWNVNSLKARLEKVRWWLERARPDVLLIQETKLADGDLRAPEAAFAELGYELAHHGQGRWNGVAIASRCGLRDVAVRFGDPEAAVLAKDGEEDPLAEARMITAVVGGDPGVRVVCLYAPNGRVVDSPSYASKLTWFARLSRWLEETQSPNEPLVLAGDLNVAPTDADVWDKDACHGGTHVSQPERDAFNRLLEWGLIDAYRRYHAEPARYTWWDYRAGNFPKNFGMRIDHLLVTAPVAERCAGSDIDREARKGKPIPSDHAPLWVDVDEPGTPVDTGWEAAQARIAARRR